MELQDLPMYVKEIRSKFFFTLRVLVFQNWIKYTSSGINRDYLAPDVPGSRQELLDLFDLFSEEHSAISQYLLWYPPYVTTSIIVETLTVTFLLQNSKEGNERQIRKWRQLQIFNRDVRIDSGSRFDDWSL